MCHFQQWKQDEICIHDLLDVGNTYEIVYYAFRYFFKNVLAMHVMCAQSFVALS